MYTSVVLSLCVMYPAMCWLIYIRYCTGVLVVTVSIAGLLVMVSSELVVLLIVCVGINTGSAQQGELTTNTECYYETTQFCKLYTHYCTLSTELCQDEDDRNCNYNSGYDKNINCVSAVLKCLNNYCKTMIKTLVRGCRFMNIGANISQPIHCYLCNTSEKGQHSGQLLWQCNITTPTPSPLPSGESIRTCCTTT